MTGEERLQRVRDQLALYEHPLVCFDAVPSGEAVELVIRFKDAALPVHTYSAILHPRDLDQPNFEWTFQQQLYACLHDYLVEMFIRTPQDRAERHRRESGSR